MVAYLLLGAEQYLDEARSFLASLGEAQAPALWEAELRAEPEALAGALVRAHQSGVAVYDTLFVELAVRARLPLATFDKALLKAFPNIAVRPAVLTTK